MGIRLEFSLADVIDGRYVCMDPFVGAAQSVAQRRQGRGILADAARNHAQRYPAGTH
jgi:hypothetical protein